MEAEETSKEARTAGEIEPPLELEDDGVGVGVGVGVESVHIVALGVMVTVFTPEYVRAMDEADPVQVFVTPLLVSAESSFKVGEETVMLDPLARVTDKVALSLTTSDWTTALEPLTLSV